MVAGGFFFAMTSLSPAAVPPAAINHLLAQESWARALLAPHAGKIAVFDAGVLALRLKVKADGLLEAASADETPAVTIRVQLADVPRILQDRARAFSYVKIEGDADFANTISQLSQSLRWEVEDDLGRVVGDIAAQRIAGGARAAVRNAQALHRSVSENVAEYFLEENPLLVRPRAVQEFTEDVTRLRDDVARLAKRIDKLKGGRS